MPAKAEVPRLVGEIVKSDKPMDAGGGRNRSSCCVIGDVDHGKSSLVGHLIWQCGAVSEKTMRSLEKQVFF